MRITDTILIILRKINKSHPDIEDLNLKSLKLGEKIIINFNLNSK